MRSFLAIFMGYMCIGCLCAQGNVGIGTTSPSEKLEVGGVIYSNNGGIRFPDQTLQQTAAFNTDPADAGMPRGLVYLTIDPGVPDTIWLVDISQGGLQSPGGPANGTPYRVIKEMDAMSPFLMELLALGDLIDEARIHFTTASGELYHTIELRNAFINDMRHTVAYQGNGTYAHLEEIEISYSVIEMRNFGPGSDTCFCWNIQNQNSCSCN